jgi:hypothetical protein
MDRETRLWVVVVAAVLLTVALAGVAHAELYKVTVSRVDANLYRVDGTKVYIQTRWCFEYAVMDDAVLRYDPAEGPYGDNRLFFDSGGECDVVKVIG